MTLTALQKVTLLGLVTGYGPLSSRERMHAKTYLAMGLLKTDCIADPSYVDLTDAGRAALKGLA